MDLIEMLQVATYIAFIAGAIFAVVELRDYKRERQMEILMRIAEHVNTREFQDAMMKMAKANAENPKELEKQVSASDLNMIANYFEHVAWLGTTGIVDRKMIIRFYPWQYFWQRLQPWIEPMRKEFDAEMLYEDIEKMAKLSEAYMGKSGVQSLLRKKS